GISNSSSGTLTLTGVVSGAGTVTNSAGTTVLSATNTYTGKNIINGGVVQITADLNLGAAPAAVTSDSITLNGGTLSISGSNISTATNRGMVLGANNGTVNLPSSSDVASFN